MEDGKNVIELKNVTKDYGDFKLDQISFSVPEGTICGFVGQNGAGKTTTIKAILDAISVDAGEIFVFGQNVKEDSAGLREDIGVVFDEMGFHEFMTGKDINIMMKNIYKNWNEDTFFEYLRRFSLPLKKPCGDFSRGMRMKLQIAVALSHKARLLIMDEPTSGLDPRTRVEFKEILEDLKFAGKTILISSHVLSELSEMCTDIGIIDQGRMVLEGNIQDILSRVNASNPLVISVYSNMEKALSILKSHPCVRTISMREKDICVRFAGDARDEAVLLQQLIDSDVLVNGFTREKGSLETVFMQLTDHEEERVVTSYEAESGL